MRNNKYEWRLKTARRWYRCNKCQSEIHKGDKYWRYGATGASTVYCTKCCPIECEKCKEQSAINHGGLPRPYCKQGNY